MFARILAAACFLAAVAIASSAHGAAYQWSAAYGDALNQQANCVAVDQIGGVVVLGNYDGTITFGPTGVTCPTSDCLFLARFDHFGNPQWSRSIDGVLELGTNKLGVDGGLNVYVVNEFNSTIDLGDGPMAPVGYRDGLIAKYDGNGTLLWTQTFGNPNSLVNVKAMNVDQSGNVIVAGTFTGSINFGGSTAYANPFKTNMFVAKFNWLGANMWNDVYEGGLIEITSVDTDPSGNAYVVGYHGSAFDFGGGSLASDPYNIFIAKYGSITGTHQWSKSLGSASTFDQAFDVAVDVNGNVHIAGHFQDPLDLGGGPMTSNGGWDIFLAKFNTNGDFQWNRSFGGTTTDRGYAVAVDASGNVCVGGHFFFGIDMGGGPITGDPIDYCVAGFDASGNHQWSERFDVDNLGLPNDKEYSISAASNIHGEIAFAGSFSSYVDCGGGNLTAGGAWDTFIAKFGAPATGIDDGIAPRTMKMTARPNPFNPQTTIAYSVPAVGSTSLHVYDVTGRLVRTLVDASLGAGEYDAVWNGHNDRGEPVSSGVYFVSLRTPAGSLSQRIVLLK